MGIVAFSLICAPNPVLAGSAPATDAYASAREAFYALQRDEKKQKFRHHWIPVIRAFERIAKRYPTTPEAPKALYNVATLLHDLYEISRSGKDCEAALNRYAEVAQSYPAHRLADDALYQRAKLLIRRGRRDEARTTLRRILQHHHQGDMKRRAKLQLNALDPKPNASGLMSRRMVVLDPGHGGRDRGATGIGGVEEATINLQISQRAAKYLRKRGFKVILTRDEDRAMSLDDRAEAAKNADLFVSIHANAAKTAKAHGIETYYLDVTHNRYAARLAHRENDGTPPNEVGLILADLATKVNARESRAFAQNVQRRLVRAARTVNPAARDLGSKPAMLHVLMGARCPAILVETAFVSNAKEAKMLQRADYQTAIAQALTEGIAAQLKETLLAQAP